MTLLRTALIVTLLNVTALAQPAPSAADASAVANADGTADVYLTISNPTMYDIYVTSATSDAAGKIDLRNGDNPAKDFTVAAYEALELKAGGMSLRLSDLKRELKAGENVRLTMMTDGGVTIVATALVRK